MAQGITLECFLEAGTPVRNFPIVNLFYTTCVIILLYGCESWVISHDMENKINAFATSCYRIMLNIKRKDHNPNPMIYSITNTDASLLYTMFEIARRGSLGTSSDVSHKKSLPVDMHSTSHLMATGDPDVRVHLI